MGLLSISMFVCDLIYIVMGLGLLVVVASTWGIGGGDPSRLAPQSSGIFLHPSAAKLKPCTFMLGAALANAHPGLSAALLHCALQPKSKWKVLRDTGQPLAANCIRADSIRQLAATILKLRTLEADSCGGYTLGPT